MKKLKAQQITEFMLATPLLIIFFAVLTEFAFAFNANLVFTNAVKSSILAYINTISADAQSNDFETAIKDYIRSDMENNRIPNLDSLNVELITVGENPTVIGSYTYNPGFTFSFLPALKRINMNASAVFPINTDDLTGYENGISTDELNLISPAATEEEEGGDETIESGETTGDGA